MQPEVFTFAIHTPTGEGPWPPMIDRPRNRPYAYDMLQDFPILTVPRSENGSSLHACHIFQVKVI